MYTCVFCNKSLGDGEPTVVLGQKGCDGIEKASTARLSELRTVVGQTVHVKCRRDYTNPRSIESYKKRTAHESEEVERHCLRSSGVFNYKKDYTFCGCPDPYDGRKSEFILTPARSFELKKTILQACDRYNTEWVSTVKGHVYQTYQLQMLYIINNVV